MNSDPTGALSGQPPWGIFFIRRENMINNGSINSNDEIITVFNNAQVVKNFTIEVQNDTKLVKNESFADPVSPVFSRLVGDGVLKLTFLTLKTSIKTFLKAVGITGIKKMARGPPGSQCKKPLLHPNPIQNTTFIVWRLHHDYSTT